MEYNLKGELIIMHNLDIKPNYAALAKKYKMDWRTVKKYYNGYEGRSKTRNKKSKLDEYKIEISDKLVIKGVSIRGVYEFMVKKYGIDKIGSYTNFNRYVTIRKLQPKGKDNGNPRFEKGPGEQAQVDWKEDIHIKNKHGELFTINVLHVVLKYSRYNYLEMTIQKRFSDVARGLINSFRKFGGVPKELLFDNMPTVSNTNVKPKKPTTGIRNLSKDFGFKIRFCKARHPKTKGTVESRNKIIDWIRAYNSEFETIEELRSIIENINKDMNITICQETEMSPTALFYKEKEYLHSLPNKTIIETYLTPNKFTVSSDGLIKYKNSKYSVDPKLIGEDVTIEIFNNKLYIYYNGKLVTLHELNENPINYKAEHYKLLMQHKVKENEMNCIVTKNLEIMDKLLDNRKVTVSEKMAKKSEDALITYINQSEYGKWVINHYAHLSGTDRLLFIKSINEVLPYVNDREKFIQHIRTFTKTNVCKTIALDCWIKDFTSVDNTDKILTIEGFEYFKTKYKKYIDSFIEAKVKIPKSEANDICKEKQDTKVLS